MLITNFSAGELSPSLFGRTDIAQYFSGVSYLENFDVIPTGGIKRRSGTKRLKELPAKGRLIPFLVNRDTGFLLHIAPEMIQVYKAENNEIIALNDPVTGIDGLPLYNENEIDEVQYAQNYNTMILVQENHPPFEVYYNGENLTFRVLNMYFSLPVVTGKEITSEEKENYNYEDEQYISKGRLITEGNYPSVVCLLNGRIVFAASKKEKQRLFVSAVQSNEDKENNRYLFATKKVFLSEHKEYVLIRGSITDDPYVIRISNISDGSAFTRDLKGYVIESSVYPPDTRIKEMRGYDIIVDKPRNNWNEITVLNQWKSQVDRLIDSIDTLNGPGQQILAVLADYEDWNGRWWYYDGSDFVSRLFIHINVSVNKFRLSLWSPDNTWFYNENNNIYIEPEYHQITQEMVDTILGMTRAQARTYLANYFYQIIYLFIRKNTTGFDGFRFSYNYDYIRIKYGYSVAPVEFDEIYDQIHTYRKYNAGTTVYKGTSDEIYNQVILFYGHGTDIYIPFCFREIIKDEYPTPDCGFTFEIASDQNDAIKWLAVNKGLIIGTEAAEWIIPPDVHASNVQAVLNSRNGSDKIPGAAVGDAAVFFQTGKKSLVEYYIPQADNHFRANNIAMMAPQMLSESPAKEFDYISSPYTKLLITREDGIIVSLLYERSSGTFAWGRITTEGKFISIAVLPGTDGNDDVYLIVQRGNVFYLECLREDGDVYTDSNEYPYKSIVRSMPVLANNQMKQNNIKNLLVRFYDSFMPKLRSLPNDKVDTITKPEPYTGVYKVNFPGTWDHDVFFELIHDTPDRCKLLAINAEVN